MKTSQNKEFETINIKPIKTEADYQRALSEVENLFNAIPDTPKGDYLDVLVTLIEAYEEKHFKIDLPDPVYAIKYYMDTHGLTRKDLEVYIGSRSRVAEILNKKRSLSLNMIRKLYEELHIPAEVLIQPPHKFRSGKPVHK